MHDGTQLPRGEVMPQAVAATQDAVADFETVDVRLRQRRVLKGAEATRQQIRLRMAVRFLFGNLALIDKPLYIGMVDAAGDHIRAPKVINPRISGMHIVAFPIR